MTLPQTKAHLFSSPKNLPRDFTGVCRIVNDTSEAGFHWYKNGKPHRENGPAKILHNGCKQWWFEGKLHRLDGPCVESPNDSTKQKKRYGKEPVKYRIHGEPFTKEEFYKQDIVVLFCIDKLDE